MISSGDIEVIVISSDDNDADAKVVLRTTTSVSPKSTHTTPATLEKHTVPASAKQPPVTVAKILAGDFGDPKTWTFGLPEPNFMDIDKLVEETLPFMQHLSEAEWVAAEARLRATNPKVYGAHPDENDRTVRYTHVERYPGGPVWFTIRWWAAGNAFGSAMPPCRATCHCRQCRLAGRIPYGRCWQRKCHTDDKCDKLSQNYYIREVFSQTSHA